MEEHFYPNSGRIEWAINEALAILKHECSVCGYDNPGHESECPERTLP